MEKSTFLYNEIYNDILNDIINSVYSAEKQLPTEQELQVKYNVSRITIKRAMDKLCNEGYIERYRGKGSFINKDFIKHIEENQRKGEEREIKQNNIYGLVISDFSDSYGSKLLAGMEEVASEKGAFIVVKKTLGNQANESKAIRELVKLNVNGIGILPVHGENYNSDIMELLIKKFPMVILDRKLKGLPVPFIGTNNFEASRMAINKLILQGHKNIAIVSTNLDGTSVIEDRIAGVKQSYEDNFLIFNSHHIFSDIESTKPEMKSKENVRFDVEKVKNFIEKNKEITAALCLEYNIACIVKKAVEELGRRVPDDFSIICFDAPENIVEDYYFTHIRQSEYEMGRKAMEILLKKKEGVTDTYLDIEFIEGKTVSNTK